MGAVTEFLKGHKTNIQAVIIAVIVGLLAAGILTMEVAAPILGLLGAGTIASIGAKIDRNKTP